MAARQPSRVESLTLDEIASEALEEFKKSWGAHTVQQAITLRSKTLWKTRFQKEFTRQLDRKLDDEIKESVASVISPK